MKKIGIMQPYFFPYLGYFSLIKHTDEFILFDPIQFIRHGWIERNRVLKQNEGWLYISVPLMKHSRNALIKDICIDNSQNWRDKIISQLQIYKKTAPHYDEVMNLINRVINHDYSDIVSLDKATLEAVCDYLGIAKKISVFSKMGFKIETPTSADEWALNICKALKVPEYWNPPGGKEFFDKSKYQKAGVNLKFQKIVINEYNQKRPIFEAGLSIVDVMMFNDQSNINKMLDNYELT